MWLFASLALLFCGISDLTLGSNLGTYPKMTVEDSLAYLYEKLAILENRELSDIVQKVRGEIIVEVEKAEKRFMERQNQLETKIAQVKSTFIDKQNDISTKLHALEERALKHETERLEVKINETKDLVQSCLALQRDAEDAIRKNTLSSVGILRILTNHSSEISSFNTRLIRVQNRCSDPPYVLNGYKINSEFEGRDHGAVITYACRGNKIPAGNGMLECNFGSWTGELPQCVDPVCNPPCENEGNCVKDNRCSCSSFYSGDRCQKAVCNPPCRNGGKCMQNNTCSCPSLFSGDRCQNARCPDPPSVENGYTINSGYEGRDHGAVITYACQDNKIPAGNKVMKCHSGEWIGELPQCVDPVCSPPCENKGKCIENNTCSCPPLFFGDRCQQDHSKCGLRTVEILKFYDLRNESGIIGGNISSPPAWPWMAALYQRSANDTLLYCGGTVIHRHFILTAAHCIQDKMYSNRIDLTVKLGLKDLKDLTHLQEYNVRTIYMHPQFSKTSWDYDIALIELEQPINYNIFIRPICLPSKEDDQFYKIQSSVQTIGWGYDRDLETYRVTNIDLNIQPPDVCYKSLLDFYKEENKFTDTLFCVSKENSSMCGAFNDGGPAMQSHRNKEGFVEWTQVGILSWRLGCGGKEVYVFFTQLQKQMPWVNTIIESAMGR